MASGDRSPEPGDPIKVPGPSNTWHWGLCVGNGYVVHKGPEGKEHPLSTAIMAMWTKQVKVKKQLLEEVVGNGFWEVSKEYDRYFTPRPVDEIIKEAESQVGREVHYDVLSDNCEHFVTKLRYGTGVSKQATDFLMGLAGAVIFGILVVVLTDWLTTRVRRRKSTTDGLPGRPQSNCANCSGLFVIVCIILYVFIKYIY